MSTERLEAVIALRDEYSEKMEKIVNETKKARGQMAKLKPVIDANDKVSAKISKIKRLVSGLNRLKSMVKLDAKDNASKKANALRKKLLKLKAKAIMLKVKDKASTIIGKVGSKLKAIVKRRWDAKVGLRDKATTGLNKIKSLLATLAAGVVIKATIQSGAQLEQQEIAMNHFMGVGNPGKSKVQIAKMSEEYMRGLRTNANATPYDTPEVIAAGTRALTISNGNTKAAMSMLKISEDMAAADPNKTLGDAIEAIADAKMGEFERLKEFGFKGSKEEFDKAGGDLMKMKSQDGKTLDQLFGGLANKQANTASGKFSTIIGNLKTANQDFGKGLLEGVSPALTKIRDKMQNLLGDEKTQSQVKAFGQRFGNGLLKGMDVISKLGKVLSDGFSNALDNDQLNLFMGTLKKLFSTVSNDMPAIQGLIHAFGFIAGTAFNIVIFVLNILLSVFRVVFHTIATIVKAAMKVPDLFSKAWEKARQKVSSAVNSVKTVVKRCMGSISSAVNSVKSAINGFKSAWLSAKKKIESNPIVQKITEQRTNTTSGNKTKSGKGKKAFGFRRVPRNDYPVRLHEGERVLTKNEANKLDGQLGGAITFNIEKVYVREENDIDRISSEFFRKIKLAHMGGA